MRRISRYLR